MQKNLQNTVEITPTDGTMHKVCMGRQVKYCEYLLHALEQNCIIEVTEYIFVLPRLVSSLKVKIKQYSVHLNVNILCTYLDQLRKNTRSTWIS